MYHNPAQAHNYVHSSRPIRVFHRYPSREHDRLRDRKRRDENEVDARVRSGTDLRGLNSTQRIYAMRAYPQRYLELYRREGIRP